MNWIGIFIIVLAFLAFPLCMLGITALAGGMLKIDRLRAKQQNRK
jgi:hypothetical protein